MTSTIVLPKILIQICIFLNQNAGVGCVLEIRISWNFKNVIRYTNHYVKPHIPVAKGSTP